MTITGTIARRRQRRAYIALGLTLALMGSGLTLSQQAANAVLPGVQRIQFTTPGTYLIVEVLDDDLAHFELSATTPSPGTGSALFTTDQIAKTNYTGPTVFSQSGSTLQTAEMKIVVNTTTLCSKVYDITKAPVLLLHEVCPVNLSQGWKGLSFSKESMENAYGLGEQFYEGGNADGDLDGRLRSPGNNYGNAMNFDDDNGPTGNTQIPVLFAVGDNNANYGLFVDQVYKQEWDLRSNPWTMNTWGDQIRWYVMTGSDLPNLRKDYMELTGKPPVPPAKAFGMWVSEFGYDNWTELDDTLSGLRTDKFPVDGAMLDVQWFGGVTAQSDSTKMGTLDWDPVKFPDAAAKIADYSTTKGIGIIPIEESYIGAALPEHATMKASGYLVRAGCSSCNPTYLTSNPWWGKGGMIDWTQPAAGAAWHDGQRDHLIDDGVMGHWLDLGEPEMFDQNDWVAGVLPGKHAHADYHNVYNLEWAKSIADGYQRNAETIRPFMLARAGAGGIQRYGVAMWSGDVGSTLSALKGQGNAQMEMSMSGIDYFGSDIGGFRREMLDTDLNQLYTQWFADSSWFDVPVRPHTENLCNCFETSPDAIGDKASNLQNIRQRYELAPYYYSLAHRANLYGEPLAPPLVYYYQNDDNVREMGNEKLIGRDVLVAMVAGENERQRDVYLPAGDWINYHSNQRITSTGQWIPNVPLYVNGKFTLPVYVRAGAILPKSFVDDQTMNIVGKRATGDVHNELISRVYANPTASNFTLYEDDGKSIAYKSGSVRTTLISQSQSGSVATVTVGAASGTYTGAPASRKSVVELVTNGSQASAVTLGGSALTKYTSKSAFDAAASGWYNAGSNLVVAKSASIAVGTAKTFAFTIGQAPVSVTFSCANGSTATGQSVYAVGSIGNLGQWSPASAVKLSPTSYPTWTGTISNLPPSSTFEWKCIKRAEANYPNTADAWSTGGNISVTVPATGSGGTTSGSF